MVLLLLSHILNKSTIQRLSMNIIITSPKMLGQLIRRVRKRKNLTQTEAGQNFNLDQTTLSSIEQGADGTRLGTIFRVLAALDLELIIQEKNKKQPKEVKW